MADDIPTRTLRLQPWIKAGGVEACFPAQRGGALILMDRGNTLLNENLSPISLQNRPPTGSFQTTHAQRLPDGGYALASSRSNRGEKNLHLFDDGGRYRTSFAVGDAIEHMVVDRKGRIWVGYFDEGIFGSDPLSNHGISRFSRSGHLDYQWDGQKHGFIADCDAFNVDDHDRAWVCPYTDYFVVEISDNNVRMVSTKSPVSNICGLVTGIAHYGLLGGTDYHGNGDRALMIIHVAKEGGSIEYPPYDGPEATEKESVITIIHTRSGDRSQVQVLDKNGAALPFRNRVQCRAGTVAC